MGEKISDQIYQSLIEGELHRLVCSCDYLGITNPRVVIKKFHPKRAINIETKTWYCCIGNCRL